MAICSPAYQPSTLDVRRSSQSTGTRGNPEADRTDQFRSEPLNSRFMLDLAYGDATNRIMRSGSQVNVPSEMGKLARSEEATEELEAEHNRLQAQLDAPQSES